jgi:hypothetical protein
MQGAQKQAAHSINKHNPHQESVIGPDISTWMIFMCTVLLDELLPSGHEIERGISLMRQIWRKARWLFVAIIAPEVVLAASYLDYCSVRNSHNEILIEEYRGVLVTSGDTDLRPDLHCGRVELPRRISTEIAVVLDMTESLSVTAASNSSLKASIPILPPPWMIEDEYHSASMLLSRLMITFHITFFFIEVFIQYPNDSPRIPLEMSTTAYIVCSITVYYIWQQTLRETERHLSKPIKARRIDDSGKDPVWQQTQHRDISSLKYIETMTLFSDSWRWGLSFGGFIFGTLHLAAWDIDFPTLREKQLWRVSCLTLMGPLVLMLLYRTFYRPVGRNFGYLTFSKEKMAALTKLLLFFAAYLYTIARLFLLVESFRISRSFPVGVD